MTATLTPAVDGGWLTGALWHTAEITTTAPRGASLTEEASASRPIRFGYYRGTLVCEIRADSPAWVRPTVESLGKLLLLRQNWDSYGSKPVDPQCVKVALDLLEMLLRSTSPSPAIVPTSLGGVQMEWHTKGIDLEIEITSPSRISACFEDHRTSAAWDTEQLFDFGPLRSALGEMARR